MQLDNYKGLIEQLIPVYDSDDFEDVFKMMTHDLTGPTRLQIKLELNRLMARCHKAVDLRGRVKGECREYHLNGLKHWLDDVAINTYHKRIKQYGDQYRVGVYEALINTRNNFRVLHKQGKLSPPTENKTITNRDEHFDVNVIRFGHYLTRGEKRIQISTPVNLNLPLGQIVHGVTSDISCSGAKIKVPSAFNYHLGQTITVEFPEIAENYIDLKIEQGVVYRVLGIDDNPDNDSYKWLRLLAISNSEAIKSAVERYQAANPTRKRNDHEDKVIQTRTIGYEHCYLKHTASMPLFFAGNELKYSLLTDHNRHIWDYWHDERNQPVINHLLSKERMATLGKAGLKQCSTLLYSFTHHHENKTHFYSAALPEMTKEQRRLFWHIGSPRDSWRVSRLTVYPLGEADLAYLSAMAPEMQEQLKNLTHIGILQDLTHKSAQGDYRLSAKPQLGANTLQVFRHQRNPIAKAQGIYFDPKPQRCEDRYLFKTPLELHHPELGKISGMSIDFSTRGLNLQLSEPVNLKRDDLVTICFKELQKIDRNVPLHKMPYKLVRISPNHTNLQLTTGSGAEVAKCESFLRRLIKNNEARLRVSEERQPEGELLHAMHQMLLTRLNSTAYFAEKVDHKARVKAVGCNFPLARLPKVFDQLTDTHDFSVMPIFQNRVNKMLAETMRPVEIREPYVHEVYLWVKRENNKIERIASKLCQEFVNTEHRIRFIQQARSKGEFFAIRVTAVPVLNPLTALTGKELGELARLTLHRARALELEFTSLIGCGEMFDITDEVLLRLEQA
ncbi:pilus assembly protein PilZ [Photobacterium jeanii]|uniref:Pilus assembly protein PilZ n=1 Tax=Photobacterium jeanii TaxID=858640 RepID=A0A178KA52_9GAMM|nr:PilZ domain-containing protein [Photobacterium jeanii]OAN14211.1 pilus assembly protein PilZ [Photobacterium jeanii]PST89731.1 PilZ domain-containing protein [Photobacterium jeanii]